MNITVLVCSFILYSIIPNQLSLLTTPIEEEGRGEEEGEGGILGEREEDGEEEDGKEMNEERWVRKRN